MMFLEGPTVKKLRLLDSMLLDELLSFLSPKKLNLFLSLLLKCLNFSIFFAYIPLNIGALLYTTFFFFRLAYVQMLSLLSSMSYQYSILKLTSKMMAMTLKVFT